ncbi:Fe-S cluster assembly transcriptional regulator IscR [Treponema sp.]
MAKLGKDGSPISIRQLSEKENISPVFLEQIFYKLRKAGVVDSVRGPGGGFRFTKPIDELSIKTLLDAAGEGLTLSPCGEKGNICANKSDCISYAIWAEATEMVNNYFEGISLGSITKRYKDFFKDEDPSCPD